MTTLSCDVAVLGGGPGGYTAALRCAGHGLSTLLIEARALGGTCLNDGCIPSKAWIHAAETFAGMRADAASRLGIHVAPPRIEIAETRSWKRSIVEDLRGGVAALMQRAGVRVVEGRGEIVDAGTLIVRASDGEATTIDTRKLVLATGSRAVELPGLPFGAGVLSSTDVFELDRLPDRLVVVGAGYIGLELGTALAKLGCRVSVVEAMDRILPQFDAPLVRPVKARLEALGVECLLSTRVEAREPGGVRVTSDAEGSRVLPADAVLVAVGRAPVVEGFGLERLAVARLATGREGACVAIDERCETSIPNVFAVGDVTGEPMLAHRAIAQARVVADVIAGESRRFDHRAVPAVCFTDPEIFSVGLSPSEASDALAEGTRPLVGQVSLAANGRARTLDAAHGMLRVVADPDDHRVVGVQAVGPGVSEVAAACGLAVEMEASLEDLAATIVAHPTLSEALSEAVDDALAKAAMAAKATETTKADAASKARSAA